MKEKGFKGGAVDYITKPYKRSVVRARIRTHLELKRHRDDIENRLKKQAGNLHDEIQDRRDMEDTYYNLVQHGREGIIIVHDFKVRFSNPAFCKMIGYSEEELMCAPLNKFNS